MQPTIINNLVPESAGDWTPGRGGNVPKYIILHTTDCSARQADAGFHSGNRQATAHRIVGLDGSIMVEVDDGSTAWGAANWPVNQAGLNLEHEDNGNYNDSTRTPQLYASSAWQVKDWGRRFGIPLQRGRVINHMPQSPGIYTHREVSQLGTACPDGLDVDRIVAQAQAGMGGSVAATVAAASVPGVTPWGPDKVRVTVDTLKVHNSPDLSDAGNFGHTGSGDGMLHRDMLADVNGYLRSAQYVIGDVASDVWCHTTSGHYFAAAGTDFLAATGLVALAAAPVAPVAAPVVPPVYTLTDQGGTVTVLPSIGANLRRVPTTDADNIDHPVEQGHVIPVVGYVEGESISGNTKWWKVPDYEGTHMDGLYISDATVSFNEPVAPAVAQNVPASVVPVQTATPAAAPSVVPAFTLSDKLDTLYVSEDFTIVDLAGVASPVPVYKGQIVQEVGTFLADGATYVLSDKSKQAGNWYGYPLDKLTTISPQTRTVTDIKPRSVVKEVAVDISVSSASTAADVLTFWQKLLSIFGFGRKKK